jgi:glycosyltransferase involved in cell wall biosynthesis
VGHLPGGGASTSIGVAVEHRLVRTPDGAFWAASGFGHDYWVRFLGEPIPVTVIARTSDAGAAPPGHDRVDGELVTVLDLPAARLDLRLPGDVARTVGRLWRRWPPGPVVATVPGIVGSLAAVVAIVRRKPFATKVVGDPIDVAFKAGVGGRLGRVAGVGLWAASRLACRQADTVAYVTHGYLQRRYPAGRSATTVVVSDVRLGAIAPAARPPRPVRRLLTVGSLEQRYKRVDLLLDALAALRAEGYDLRLDVVGGGRYQQELVDRAAALGLADVVSFHGHVGRDEVERRLAEADVFALCSDTEGLPRALIEALAAGVPSVGSRVGGVPELLPPEALFTPGSIDDLVRVLRRIIDDDALRSRLSASGLVRAADFAPDVMTRATKVLRDAVLVGSRPGALQRPR